MAAETESAVNELSNLLERFSPCDRHLFFSKFLPCKRQSDTRFSSFACNRHSNGHLVQVLTKSPPDKARRSPPAAAAAANPRSSLTSKGNSNEASPWCAISETDPKPRASDALARAQGFHWFFKKENIKEELFYCSLCFFWFPKGSAFLVFQEQHCHLSRKAKSFLALL
jgi:hypothetical protein